MYSSWENWLCSLSNDPIDSYRLYACVTMRLQNAISRSEISGEFKLVKGPGAFSLRQTFRLNENSGNFPCQMKGVFSYLEEELPCQFQICNLV